MLITTRFKKQNVCFTILQTQYIKFPCSLRQNKDLWLKKSKTKTKKHLKKQTNKKTMQNSTQPLEILYSIEVPRTSQHDLSSAQNQSSAQNPAGNLPTANKRLT